MLDNLTLDVYTCVVRAQDTNKPRPTQILLPCACANLRRTARSVTRMYNRELRSQRIEVTQFTLLMALNVAGEISQGRLARLLALDSTTLTRMLELLKKRGWIQEKEGEDRRFRLLRLTAAGRAKYEQSLPHWQRAQDRMESALGEDTVKQLKELLTQVSATTEV
jgi:DNA-binding MarR family transcriptional regulator